ncbi:hypothetical protein EXT67_20445 [Pectobacterium atrosepticum]|uniref:Uncharacterized protein n=1 Tax=Pectobacterium phage phiTE TaxID=1116482 RepID=K9L3S7_9CAUD|nr:hypothetical protein [Pectobacterium atrosepticum]YP_007392570.1 hypothetical protein phiTE_108 [Pectobacterium phage phiTE]AEZ66274.1 hypothetical protein phiTE_108 [Pectobacterium phage phiTE]MCL6318676.1 hypothetical protein [Pectobacterium atrosepticum]
MTFKPHRVQEHLQTHEQKEEAAFHKAIKVFLSKKDQGRVMGVFREFRDRRVCNRKPLPGTEEQEPVLGEIPAVHVLVGYLIKIGDQTYEVTETDFDDHDVTLWLDQGAPVVCAAGCLIDVIGRVGGGVE